MGVHLNQGAFDHAKQLINEGRAVRDERDAWSEHQPTPDEENEFIREHGVREYAKWHLGLDDEENEDTKAHYNGDFENVHRCGLHAAESRAGQRKYHDIEDAAAHLHGMLDAVMTTPGRTGKK